MKNCHISNALKIIGGKWKLLIIWTILQNEVIRFNDLQRKIDGISSLMLSKNLKELEADGLVLRHQYNEIPPRVEYTVSELSQKLIVVLHAIDEWGSEAEAVKKSL
jgi:DNA-binding HxlR family transcriptional regulator